MPRARALKTARKKMPRAGVPKKKDGKGKSTKDGKGKDV